MDNTKREAIREGVIQSLKDKGKYRGHLEPVPCKGCGHTYHPSSKKQRYCSRTCRPPRISSDERKKRGVIAVVKRRTELKKKAVELLGGCCLLCGYHEYYGALEFHHVDPSSKEFSLSGKGSTMGWDKAKEELKKCVLLCANCHREVHANIKSVPVV